MPTWYSEPHIALAVVFVVVGFYVLIRGADFLVEGGVSIAKRHGMQPAVIGATIVAFGTSLPELVVTLGSCLKAWQLGQMGDPDGPAAIAVGNIVGSNIFNIGAILGITAMIRVIPVPRSTFRLDYPLMFVAMTLMILFSLPIGDEPPTIGRIEGLILVLGLIGFTGMAMRMGKIDTSEVEELSEHAHSSAAAFGFIGIGIMMLALGGEVALTGAIKIANSLGMSERVIGLTIMAIGTSLPELATTVAAARRGHTEIAIGNVVGSNIFNVLCIAGISSVIVPLPIAAATLEWDYFWMMGFTLILLPMLITGKRVGKGEGLLLLVALITYVSLLVIDDTMSNQETAASENEAAVTAPP